MDVQLLSEKIDNVKSFLCNRLDKLDEHKDAYKQYLKEREISSGKDDIIEKQRITIEKLREELQDLKNEIEGYKEKEQQAKLSQCNPVLKGAKFEEDSQIILTDLCKTKDNVVLKTSNVPHSADNVVIFQNSFKIAIDWKNYQTKTNKKGEENCKIDTKQVDKLMSDAKKIDAHAAILVYPSLESCDGFCDFMYEPGKGSPELFNKNMVIACTPKRIYEAFLTLMARYIDSVPKIKTISEENTIITQNLSELCRLLMKTVRPMCEAFGTTDKKNTMNDWGKEVGKLILNLQNQCSDCSDCDANLIALKKEVNGIFDILSIKKGWPNVFGQKRKLDCDEEDVPNKKTKLEN